MNDDPSAVNVLHTAPNPSAAGKEGESARDNIKRINQLCSLIFHGLQEAGVAGVTQEFLHSQRLLSPAGETDIKVHCTCFNTKFYNQYLEREKGFGGGKAANVGGGGGVALVSATEQMRSHGGGDRDGDDGDDRFQEVKYVNATQLLAAFDNFQFGEFEVRDVHFSDLMAFEEIGPTYRRLMAERGESASGNMAMASGSAGSGSGRGQARRKYYRRVGGFSLV